MTQGTKVGCNGRAGEAVWTLNVRRAGDGNDESGPYSPTSTPVKKIRVVSTFEFELNRACRLPEDGRLAVSA